MIAHPALDRRSTSLVTLVRHVLSVISLVGRRARRDPRQVGRRRGSAINCYGLSAAPGTSTSTTPLAGAAGAQGMRTTMPYSVRRSPNRPLSCELHLRRPPRTVRSCTTRRRARSACSAVSTAARDPLDGVDGTPTLANPWHYTDNDPLNRVDPLGLRGGGANLRQLPRCAPANLRVRWCAVGRCCCGRRFGRWRRSADSVRVRCT